MRIVSAALLVVVLAGCSSLLYRVPIVQGNIVSQEKLRKLELGMTQPQVRYLLGTPLVNSGFVQERWDYVFYFRNSRGQDTKSQLTLFFENGKLARIKGDKQYQAVLPEEHNDLNPEDLESTDSRPLLPSGRDPRAGS